MPALRAARQGGGALLARRGGFPRWRFGPRPAWWARHAA